LKHEAEAIADFARRLQEHFVRIFLNECFAVTASAWVAVVLVS